MLALGRKRGESITMVVGGMVVVVKVYDVGKAVVRLAIEAPPEVRIIRTELLANGTNPKATPQGPGTS